MLSETFWEQFWPQFFGSIAATLCLAVLTIVFTYIARLHIALFFKRMLQNAGRTLRAEEEKFSEKQ